MFGWLKDAIAPTRMEHPQLGGILFNRDVEFWEGNVPFGGIESIEVAIWGPASGPAEVQIAFLREAEAR
jgi:hypothetical protein